MWFKQVTCDKCFTPLNTTGRHNCYIFLKILKSKIIASDSDYKSYIPYKNEYQFAFPSFKTNQSGGNLYMFSISNQDLSLKNKTWFCDNKCALGHSRVANQLMLYYDENLRSVRIILPDLIQINRELNNSDLYMGLPFNWGNREWLIPASKFKDLRIYNVSSSFPEIMTKRLSLTQAFPEDKLPYQELISDVDFQRAFWGNINQYACDQSYIDKHFNQMSLNYGRRFGIEWIIRLNRQFIGFIRMNSIYPNDPYKWYIEAGLKKDFRNNGFMKEALIEVFKWCKSNSIDTNIYGISETSNNACLNLIKKLPYEVRTQTIPAYDRLAGERMIMKHEIVIL